VKKGICPKCQSKEIFCGTHVSGKSGWSHSNTIPITAWRPASLDNYVCGNCGYVESYIAKEKDLLTIRKKWPVVD
jgi:ribosomal protein S27AE